MPEPLLSWEKRNRLMLEPKEVAEVLLTEITKRYQLRSLTKRRRGAPTGPRRPDRDLELRLLHDGLTLEASRKGQRWSGRQTGEFAHKFFKGRYGATALGIKTKPE